jgi:hypothetical protein
MLGPLLCRQGVPLLLPAKPWPLLTRSRAALAKISTTAAEAVLVSFSALASLLGAGRGSAAASERLGARSSLFM